MSIRLAVILCLLCPLICTANVGQRWWGERTAEPVGISYVDIVREDLEFDLRPLERVEPVVVSATYYLQNPERARTLELAFVTYAERFHNFEVRLDGKRIESKVLGSEVPDPNHLTRREGIGFGTPQSGYFDLYEQRSAAFRIEIPQGSSKLTVRYRAKAFGIYDPPPPEGESAFPTTTWNVPYLLAPARQWKSFGTLNVTARVPNGWHAKSEPPSRQEGDALVGSFEGLPADNLVIATRMPSSPELNRCMHWAKRIVYGGAWSGWVLCLVVGFWWGWHSVRRQPHADLTPRFLLVWFGVGMVAVLIWACLLSGSIAFAEGYIEVELKGQQPPDYSMHPLFDPLSNIVALIAMALAGGVSFFFASLTSITAGRCMSTEEPLPEAPGGSPPAGGARSIKPS